MVKHRWWLYTEDRERVYTGYSCCGLSNHAKDGEIRFRIGGANEPISCKKCLKCRRCKPYKRSSQRARR